MSHSLQYLFSDLEGLAENIVAAMKTLDVDTLAEHRADLVRIEGAATRFTHQLKRSSRLCLDSGIDVDSMSRIRHDLRGQIGAIQGYTELIIEELSAATAHCAPSLRAIVHQTAATLPLIDQLRPARDSAPEKLRQVFSSHEEHVPDYKAQYQDSTVLVIDDSDDNRHLMSRRLRAAGLKVFESPTGSDGLRVLSERRIDLILLDVQMPGMTGLELLGHLKRHPIHADIPVLVISAVSEVETIADCITSGAEDYLATPLNPIVLHARVKASLDKKLLRDMDRARMKELAEAREELVAAIESIDDGFAIFDQDERLVRANRKYHELYPSSASHTHLESILQADRKADVYFQERRGRRSVTERSDENWLSLYLARHRGLDEFTERLRDGRWIEIRTAVTPTGSIVSVHKDVTTRKRDEEHLTYLAHHDPLTGLANRAHFESALNDALGAEPFALLYLDLDQFKSVNDTLGHRAGDELLRAVAKIMTEGTRQNDATARLGGDEFVAILRTDDRKAVERIAERLRVNIASASPSGAHVTASIGVAFSPRDGDTAEALLEAADSAMYGAKEKKDRIRFTSRS
ncbi:MAG: diguanylate cyclase (GGDEF)-like protein [Polyangiales bacterium]